MAKPKAFEINRDQQPTPTNPHSWLVLFGNQGEDRGPGNFRIMTGTLRVEHRGYRPSLSAFVQAKLAVAADPAASPWTVTTHRHEVLLPAHAGDHLLDPRTLIEAAEREQAADPKALASYITLTSRPDRLHAAYEVARALARRLVAEHDVAVLLVQHVPARNGSDSAPHCHLVVPGPRKLTRWSGYGGFVSELAGDKMRDLVLSYLGEIVGETTS